MPNFYEKMKKEDYNSIPFGEWRANFNKEVDAKTKMYQRQYGFEIGTKKGHETWNNESDAFKHAFMQALLQVRYGEMASIAIGYGHEIENLKDGAELIESNMDLWNNAKGREIARNFLSYLKQNDMRLEDLSEKQMEDYLAGVVVQYMKTGQLITFPEDKRRWTPEAYKIDFSKYKKPHKNKNKNRFFTLDEIKKISNEDFNIYSEEIMNQYRREGFPTNEQAIQLVADGNLDYVYPADEISGNRYVVSANQIWVEAYTRQDGTKVSGYYRRKSV